MVTITLKVYFMRDCKRVGVFYGKENSLMRELNRVTLVAMCRLFQFGWCSQLVSKFHFKENFVLSQM